MTKFEVVHEVKPPTKKKWWLFNPFTGMIISIWIAQLIVSLSSSYDTHIDFSHFISWTCSVFLMTELFCIMYLVMSYRAARAASHRRFDYVTKVGDTIYSTLVTPVAAVVIFCIAALFISPQACSLIVPINVLLSLLAIFFNDK